MRTNCERCHGSGLEVIDYAKDGAAILGDCRDCKEYEKDREEALAEDAADARREDNDLPRELFLGGPRPADWPQPFGMDPNYDGLD